MPTPAERQALLFVAAVIALGAGVRAVRSVWAREPVPAAEIGELVWLAPRAPFPVQVAPLSATRILPAWRAWRAGSD